MSAIQHRENAEWPFLRLSWLGYPDPSGRLWFDGLVVAQALDHDKTLCRFDGFHAINASRAFSLVVLCHLSYRKGTGSLGCASEVVAGCERLCHCHDQRLDRSVFAVGTPSVPACARG